MEALNDKRARLHDELEQAFSEWMTASEGSASSEPVDVSGCPDAAKPKWLEYLAAERRLTSAYAEQRWAA